ncbi:precorrin-6y C5,15-methyltransferase (decarboxylating) subunit CbiE [Ancylobacter sp. MQZ15Z-1]|uniref:Precorrin-6y C5,15-methyltransferase (Decarboxylating) subunit CbiE n=1 Tax=Ancylobacter mangrovi TaxID=2972472 RepID=A0A9X2T7S0_9HYPH|nr:precorrin-6y C5,15-methyltransferase (decarboxylating) subunit CbiE [Ancylobacter mangrovi]MCS0496373.1 precorrin-6y C5,15-methyltransferase (decarboxylating) subunit CbiE [Ancylobacter mangrovi]
MTSFLADADAGSNAEVFAPGARGDDAQERGWLSIVGIGEDGLAGLSPAARAAIERAEIVFGGARHLALAGAAVTGRAQAWPSPFEHGVEMVLAARGRRVCVLASGDPFLYGVGAVLARHVPADEMRAIPAPSSFSLAAARIGWPLADTACLTVHGRALDLIRAHLHPGRRLLALTSDGEGPQTLARLMSELGFGQSRIHVLEALGGPRERVRTALAATFDLDGIDTLNLVGIEVVAGEGARIIALTPGLPDELYEHDGQLTKREVRAMTLGALAPRRGETLWDIGAGAGSIGIEWMLADPSLKAIAIEEVPARAARARRNASAMGVPGLKVIEGRAPQALGGLAPPDAIFIGGGAGDAGVVEAALAALKPGGRLVVNAVTLETEARLIALHAARGGELVRLSIARAAPVGELTGWRPAMPVTQWSWTRPAGEAARGEAR